MIKIERFYSSWNDIKSDEAYHVCPSQETLAKAQKTGKAYEGDLVVFMTDKTVEVHHSISSGLATNNYRDLYRIKA